MARSRQLELKIATWGGARAGAGRPRTLPRVELAHRSRDAFARLPLHVTMRMAAHVFGLRSRRSLRVVRTALLGSSNRFDVRVVQVSVQGNHLHLLVEAPDQRALGRAMKGLAVRVARGMNKLMGKSGRVIGDRYHSRALRTPTEVRRVMHYIRANHQHHATGRAAVDEYSSDGLLADAVVSGRLCLVTTGYRRGRATRSTE